MESQPERIGIAVVEHRGRYLVGTRPAGKPLAGCDEFPGGKCRKDESPAKAAVRECLEETGLEVVAVDLLMRRVFTYPHGAVELNFWLCRPSPRVKVADSQGTYRWVPAAELKSLNFPEANQPLIAALTQP